VHHPATHKLEKEKRWSQIREKKVRLYLFKSQFGEITDCGKSFIAWKGTGFDSKERTRRAYRKKDENGKLLGGGFSPSKNPCQGRKQNEMAKTQRMGLKKRLTPKEKKETPPREERSDKKIKGEKMRQESKPGKVNGIGSRKERKRNHEGGGGKRKHME